MTLNGDSIKNNASSAVDITIQNISRKNFANPPALQQASEPIREPRGSALSAISNMNQPRTNNNVVVPNAPQKSLEYRT